MTARRSRWRSAGLLVRASSDNRVKLGKLIRCEGPAFGLAPMILATSARAPSMASSDSHPYRCVRECGLPYESTKYGIIASSTRGSTGVVACVQGLALNSFQLNFRIHTFEVI